VFLLKFLLNLQPDLKGTTLKISKMRNDIHPEDYRLVVFKDMSNDYSFLCPSCASSNETVTWEDGNEYPLVKLDISHKSHPFFTGIVQFVDTAGRIDKFKNRYGRHMK
jgi:large subunit ribosomal protein L31